MALRELGQFLRIGRDPQKVLVPFLEGIPTKDKLTRGLLSLSALCHDEAYTSLSSPRLEWPYGFRPAQSYELLANTRKFPQRFREILGIKETDPEIELNFGGRWEMESGQAIFYLKTGKGKDVLVFSTRARQNMERPSLEVTHFSTDRAGGKAISLSPRTIESLFSETAILALECLEKQLQTKQAGQ